MNHFANSMLDFSCRLLLFFLSQTLISVNLISFLHCVYRRCCCAMPTPLYITAQGREWNFKRRKRGKNKVFHLRNWFFVNPPLLTSNFSLFSIHTHSWLLLLIFLSSVLHAFEWYSPEPQPPPPKHWTTMKRLVVYFLNRVYLWNWGLQHCCWDVVTFLCSFKFSSFFAVLFLIQLYFASLLLAPAPLSHVVLLSNYSKHTHEGPKLPSNKMAFYNILSSRMWVE